MKKRFNSPHIHAHIVTYVMCGDQCLSIKAVCLNTSYIASCGDQFHLHCKQTNDKNQVNLERNKILKKKRFFFRNILVCL